MDLTVLSISFSTSYSSCDTLELQANPLNQMPPNSFEFTLTFLNKASLAQDNSQCMMMSKQLAITQWLLRPYTCRVTDHDGRHSAQCSALPGQKPPRPSSLTRRGEMNARCREADRTSL